MWHKTIWKGHPMRLELTRVGLLVELANHYTTKGAWGGRVYVCVRIFVYSKAFRSFCFPSNNFSSMLIWNHLFYDLKVRQIDRQEGDPKASFSIATTPGCRGGRNSFPEIASLTLDPYLIIQSVKQGGI